jgi:hypothetical protein
MFSPILHFISVVGFPKKLSVALWPRQVKKSLNLTNEVVSTPAPDTDTTHREPDHATGLYCYDTSLD